MNAIRRQIRSMLRVEPRAGGFIATFEVKQELMVFPDHFAEFPILPGVCMIQAILLAGAEASGSSDMRLVSMKNAKMTRPILPGETITIEATMTAVAAAPVGGIAIKATFSGGGERRAEFSLVARPVSEKIIPS